MYWRKDDEHRERVVAQNIEASASNAVVRGENSKDMKMILPSPLLLGNFCGY
jgi:hypothetical protein